MALPLLCDWLVLIKSWLFFTEIDCMALLLLCDWLVRTDKKLALFYRE